MSQNHILRTRAAADRIGHAASTLEKWRCTGQGPRFVKVGTRSVGYLERDLDEFVEAGRRASTSDPGPQPPPELREDAAPQPRPRGGPRKRKPEASAASTSAAPAPPECQTPAGPQRGNPRKRAPIPDTGAEPP
jgi:predicted DNA-binding transcriptional regulator AlpA